jgi:hypothetical protein
MSLVLVHLYDLSEQIDGCWDGPKLGSDIQVSITVSGLCAPESHALISWDFAPRGVYISLRFPSLSGNDHSSALKKRKRKRQSSLEMEPPGVHWRFPRNPTIWIALKSWRKH